MSNFKFLSKSAPLPFQLANAAEQNFVADPNTTLIKLRQFAEALTQDIAARSGVDYDSETTQAVLLGRVDRELRLDRVVMRLFHFLRKAGNKATHEFRTQHRDAIDGLRVAHKLSAWYFRSFYDQDFKQGKFIAPSDPSQQLRDLQEEIQRLRAESRDKSLELDHSKEVEELLKKEKEEYAVLAQQMDAEARLYAEIATEHEEALQKQHIEFEKELEKLRIEAKADTEKVKARAKQAQSVAKDVELTEQLTRILIDQQLSECGWEVDTEELTYAKGARPEKGKNRAISEWPTQGRGRADYVLFIGLTPVAVVEAKKENVDVAGKIGQAERYSMGFTITDSMKVPWELSNESGPWKYDSLTYQIPFVFSANGREYVKQLKEKSGIWFRDVRKPSNIKDAIHNFFSPEGLIDRLKADKAAAEEKLRNEGFNYLKLRDYQEKAIKAVEAAMEKGQDRCLLAMATGTGKTRTIIGLMYRFLKANRFKRILFLVDRTSLGDQALDSFNEAPLEQSQPLSKIYNVAELGDMASEAETRIQVATVQAMVKRVFMSDDRPTVDTFDCIIVDEAHRGYTLDQEMTEGELELRDTSQYLSSYRRVLEYFDATLIGLTATPAQHTSEIFGKPVYTYSYREAVADYWLIDHEEPIRYETLLTKNGIHFERGTVDVVNTKTGAIDTAELEDEMHFDSPAFNRRVITESFNRVICKQLATAEIDPFSDEKVMIFCATDSHADMVKRLLDEEFQAMYGEEYNEAAVLKITGQTYQVKQQIKRYKNERYPSIAITVDLLTTGIDVPKICHLVFLRAVRSRILYEQMIGRATRLCDEIGKTVFKIYDPVDLYKTLEEINTMKPLVKNPNIPLPQLLEELEDPASYSAPGTLPDMSHAHDVLNAVNQKVMRILREATKKAEDKPDVQQKLDELENMWGVKPAELHRHLHGLGPQEASHFIRESTNLVQQLEEVKMVLGSRYFPLVSGHEDQLVTREQSYGGYNRPEDYLESFEAFIKRSLNDSVALKVVVNRPKDLTREQLKEVRLLLDANGYSETKLRTAWRGKTNQEIAASVVGHIRRAALGVKLVSFEKRVEQAMEGILTSQNWSPIQKKWLNRIAKQLTHEIVIDSNFVNKTFATDGGAKRVDSFLGNRLDEVMERLAETLWVEAI